MYLSYLLDKDNGMYPNSVRHPAQTLNSHLPGSPQYLPPPLPYGDFAPYHHISGLCEPPNSQSTGVWNPAYAAPWEEWSTYGHSAGFPGSNLSSGQTAVDRGFTTPDLTSIISMPPFLGGSLPSNSLSPRHYSPHSPRRKSEWIRQGHPSLSGGKTRTKDKYRVVYSDQQRMDLEGEFLYNRYITIKRKADLALTLCLSERQVKIWFQNRRAKERKVNRRKLQLSQQASTTTPTPLVIAGPTDGPLTIIPSSDLLPDEISMAVKEEY